MSMKKCLIKSIFMLLISACFLNINSQENLAVAKGNIRLGDLIFFPEAGQLMILPALNYGNTIASVTYNSIKMMDVKESSNSVGLQLGYGITNNLVILLKSYYLVSDNVEINLSNSVPDKSNSKGFKDPEFGVTDHILEEKSNGIITSTSVDEAISGMLIGMKLGILIIPNRFYGDVGYSKSFPLKQKITSTQNNSSRFVDTLIEANIISTSVTLLFDI